MAKINKDLIESIKVYRKSSPYDWSFWPARTKKRLFGGIKEVPARIKSFWSDQTYTVEEFTDRYKDRYYVEDGEVYEYPHVVVKMPSGEKFVKHFETESELDKWLDEKAKGMVLIGMKKL